MKIQIFFKSLLKLQICKTNFLNFFIPIFNLLVDYLRGESPHCILTGKFDNKATSPLIALSNSAKVIAIAVGSDVQLFSGVTGELDTKIEGIFNDNIVVMEFESLGNQLFVAGDRQVRIFVNITGYKIGINEAKTKLKDPKISTAQRDRLEAQVEEYEAVVQQYQ